MNPELSHRVALLMGTKTILALSPGERKALAYEVDRANSFLDLSGRTMELVLKAEKERGQSGDSAK